MNWLIAIMVCFVLGQVQAQDFEMMQKEIDKIDLQVEAELHFIVIGGDTFGLYYFRTTDSDSTWKHDLAIQRANLIKEYYRIYREEYLRMIARKFLDTEFSKTEEWDKFLQEYWEAVRSTMADTLGGE